MSNAKARLKEIINAYLDKDSDIVVDTGVVASHIAQMKLFGIRQGVEFFPSQDNFGAQRKDFLDRVLKYNKMDTRLDSIWEYFLCDGKGLFYIRPTKQSYRLYYFREHEYRSYYNVDGELVVRVDSSEAPRNYSVVSSRKRNENVSFTEELFGCVAGLNDLYDAGTQCFDAWYMVGQDAHVTGRSGKVNLNDICGSKNRLFAIFRGQLLCKARYNSSRT